MTDAFRGFASANDNTATTNEGRRHAPRIEGCLHRLLNDLSRYSLAEEIQDPADALESTDRPLACVTLPLFSEGDVASPLLRHLPRGTRWGRSQNDRSTATPGCEARRSVQLSLR